MFGRAHRFALGPLILLLPGAPQLAGAQVPSRPVPAPLAKRPAPPRVKKSIPPTSAAAKKMARARALFARGVGLFLKQNFAGAVPLFVEALTLWDHPSIRFNLGVIYIQQGRYSAGYEQMRRVVRDGREKIPRRWQQAREHLKKLEKRVAHVTIRCASPGAEVSLNGTRLFTAPGTHEVVVDPGRHHLVASKTRHVTVSRHITAEAGRRATFSIKLFKGIEAFCVRSVYRYHWAVPTGVAAAAAVAIGVGGYLLGKGQDVVSATAEKHKTAFNTGGGLASVPVDRAQEQRGRRLQATGFALFGVSAAVAIAAGLLWYYWKKQVRYQKREEFIRSQR